MFPKIVGFPTKSSILIGFSIINHPFWGTPICGNTHMQFLGQFEEIAQDGNKNVFTCRNYPP